jgi:hypothetical protein
VVACLAPGLADSHSHRGEPCKSQEQSIFINKLPRFRTCSGKSCASPRARYPNTIIIYLRDCCPQLGRRAKKGDYESDAAGLAPPPPTTHRGSIRLTLPNIEEEILVFEHSWKFTAPKTGIAPKKGHLRVESDEPRQTDS